MSTAQPNDKAAAFTGMIVTAVLLFALCFGLVKWTNAKFAAHKAQPAATTTH